MKPNAIISLLLLVAAVSGVGAQELSKEPDHSANRPLNLSIRKTVVPVTDAVVLPVDTETKNDQTQSGSIGSEAADASLGMPYGAGYESRQQGAMVGSRSTGGGNSSGGSNGGGGSGGGNGGSGGRGGSGRGR
jgi:hypothetical protein